MTSLPRCFLAVRSRWLRGAPLAIVLSAVQGCAAAAPPHGAAAPQAAAAGLPAAPAAYPGAAPVAQAAPAPAPAGVAAAPASDAAAKTALGIPGKAPDARSAKNGGLSAEHRAPVIIYQGDLHMIADEDAIPKTIDKIIDVAESLGGNIGGRKDQSVSIKVPSASFREAMTKIEGLGGVVNRAVTADDVSEEFHDLEVRLGNLRATRTRLQEFLGRATGIADMLTVERELERVSQEIDRIEGRLEFLRTRAAMSVITVQLTAKPKIVPLIVTPPPPARSAVDLPIPWVGEVGIDPLLSLRK